jgi:diguanylate cyclase (GGDEF)-like protein/PAS domain S-box-containing protein
MANENEQYKEILESLYDGVYFVDLDRRINYWNKGAERISGHPVAHILGRFCQDNILNHVTESGIPLCTQGCPLLATMQDGNPREVEIYLHHADGRRLPVLIHTTAMRDEKGEIVGGVEVFSDNSALLSMRRRMRRLEDTISLDPLTGIGNRRYMERRLKLALADFESSSMPFCVLYLDIDFFKNVNDTHGHEAGDGVLRAVARTLRENLRNDDAAARWGGDEFVVLLADTRPSGMAITAEKLRKAVEACDLTRDDGGIRVTASIGGTAVRADDTPESVLDRADRHRYRSKAAGRNRVAVDQVETGALRA